MQQKRGKPSASRPQLLLQLLTIGLEQGAKFWSQSPRVPIRNQTTFTLICSNQCVPSKFVSQRTSSIVGKQISFSLRKLQQGKIHDSVHSFSIWRVSTTGKSGNSCVFHTFLSWHEYLQCPGKQALCSDSSPGLHNHLLWPEILTKIFKVCTTLKL